MVKETSKKEDLFLLNNNVSHDLTTCIYDYSLSEVRKRHSFSAQGDILVENDFHCFCPAGLLRTVSFRHHFQRDIFAWSPVSVPPVSPHLCAQAVPVCACGFRLMGHRHCQRMWLSILCCLTLGAAPHVSQALLAAQLPGARQVAGTPCRLRRLAPQHADNEWALLLDHACIQRYAARLEKSLEKSQAMALPSRRGIVYLVYSGGGAA